MHIRRCLALLLTLDATLLAACGAAPPPNQPADRAAAVQAGKASEAAVAVQPAAIPPAPVTAPGGANGNASVKAFRDPITGELRAPTEAELRAVASAAGPRTGADLKATAPIEGRPIGHGVVEYEVGKRGTVDEVACLQRDGSVTTHCPSASQPK